MGQRDSPTPRANRQTDKLTWKHTYSERNRLKTDRDTLGKLKRIIYTTDPGHMTQVMIQVIVLHARKYTIGISLYHIRNSSIINGFYAQRSNALSIKHWLKARRALIRRL